MESGHYELSLISYGSQSFSATLHSWCVIVVLVDLLLGLYFQQNSKVDHMMHGDPRHLVFNYVGPWRPLKILSGYGACQVLTGPDFQSVFNLQLWASNAKLINYYMLYG